MKFMIFAAGFIGAGLIGAIAGQVLFQDQVTAPSAPGDNGRLDARVDDLATEVARLGEEVRRLRSARPLAEPAPTAGGPSPANAPAGIDGPAAIVPGSEWPSASAAAIPETMIEDKVRETVNEIAREQREEKARWAEAKQAEKEAAWLESIRAEVGLNDFQVEELLKLMKERRAFIVLNKRKYAAVGPDITPQQREALQQEAADYGRQLDLELRKVLDPAQYDSIMNRARKQNDGR